MSIFQSRAWLEALLDCGDGKTCFYRFDLAARNNISALLGEPPQSSPIATRQLWFNESGDTALDRIYPEYNDVIGATNQDERTEAIICLFEGFPKTEEFYFRNCAPEMTEAVRSAAAKQGFQAEAFQTQSTWRIDLSRLRLANVSVTESLSGSTRRRLRQATSFFERRGPLSIRFATTQNRSAVWQVMCDLHQKSWAARGEEGVFSNKALIDFHQTLARKAPESVHLLTLVCGDAPIGVLYNLAFGATIANYQSGFARETDNKARPGIVSHILAADYYAQQGFNAYDLLGGGDHYKSTLATQGEKLTSLVVSRPTLKTRSREAFKSLAGGLRQAAGKRQT